MEGALRGSHVVTSGWLPLELRYASPRHAIAASPSPFMQVLHGYYIIISQRAVPQVVVASGLGSFAVSATFRWLRKCPLFSLGWALLESQRRSSFQFGLSMLLRFIDKPKTAVPIRPILSRLSSVATRSLHVRPISLKVGRVMVFFPVTTTR